MGDEGTDLCPQRNSSAVWFEPGRHGSSVALTCCAGLGTGIASSTQMFHLFRMHPGFPGGHLWNSQGDREQISLRFRFKTSLLTLTIFFGHFKCSGAVGSKEDLADCFVRSLTSNKFIYFRLRLSWKSRLGLRACSGVLNRQFAKMKVCQGKYLRIMFLFLVSELSYITCTVDTH